MKITGQLKDDILNGKAVLFLGAGVSQAAGLLDTNGLANYLFLKANSPTEYERYKEDLPRLVAKLEKNPAFTIRWVYNKLKEYLMDEKNYTDLSYHKKIFQLHWKAIFTTNFDKSLELAEYFADQKKYRLLPVVNPIDKALFADTDVGKLKYFKIHGCCIELEQHPSDAPPLVITQKDFQDSISRNQPFLEELCRYTYDCSIIFIGFQAHRSENNPILASVQEACHSIASSFHQPFRPFAILKNVDEDTKSDFEDIGITLVEGTFEEFIDTVILLKGEQEKRVGVTTIEDKIYIKTVGKEIELTRAEYTQYASQFTCYYEGYFEEEANKLKKLQQTKIIDLWKTNPSDMFFASGRYIKRTMFNDAVMQLKNSITNVAKNKSPQIFFIEGNRASGKTVVARQLTQYAYTELNQPVLILTPQASYFDKPHGATYEISVSGWDGRLIDKFLSLFYGEGKESDNNVVPILLADHLSYRQFALDHLLKYLENHGKSCVLILTLNTDEWNDSAKDRLFQLYKHLHIHIEHKLDNDEIELLFEKISIDEPKIRDIKDILLGRAKNPSECNRDILFILYVWFDKQFRKLDEIIAEETEKLSSDPHLNNLFLSIAIFHQYNFSPRVSLCAEGLNISINTFSELRNKPAFKAFINLTINLEKKETELASTRHSEFSRKVLNRLMPELEKQIELMERILKQASSVDIQFVRDFLNYIYRYGISFTVKQVTRLKIATENKLRKEYVLNHQFAAYLIREKVSLDDARYYLDIALQEDPNNASIIHSLGNLCSTLYKNALEKGNSSEAKEYFEHAKEYFSRSRALMNIHDEHGYFTDIDMTRYRIKHGNDDERTKTLLNAESQAMTLEALRVIPFERQNLLWKIIGEGVTFEDLPEPEKEVIVNEIKSEKASPILLEYYSKSLLSRPNTNRWNKLKEIVSHYGKINSDIATSIVVGLISKKAFMKNAETRFESLRIFCDKIVRYREAKINFALIAEYTRLLLIDAFVLEKYEFLRSVTGDIKDLFRESLPRFLEDEFILDKRYYIFDENNGNLLKDLFTNNSLDFYSHEKAKRFSKLVNLSGSEHEKYFYIEVDPITRYFIRGLRKEVGTRRGRVELN
ncbi:MAG: SIR2 family protein, partial [Candidatus Brocadiales bacterium]|nr:SIR2 family protein [Candidatus Brocadiales bacterium]